MYDTLSAKLQCIYVFHATIIKWYFPLAEVRKKRIMISHTLLGPDNSRVLEGGAGCI